MNPLVAFRRACVVAGTWGFAALLVPRGARAEEAPAAPAPVRASQGAEERAEREAHEERGAHGERGERGERGEHEEHGEPRVVLDVDEVLGEATVGLDKFVASSTVVSVGWNVNPSIALAAYVPFVVVTGSAISSTNLNPGDLAFAGTYRVRPSERTLVAFELLAALPTFGGDNAGFAAAVASYSRAFELDELFAIDRFSFVPKVEVEHEVGRLTFGGYVKVPLLVAKTGGLPERNDVAVDFTFAAQAMYALTGEPKAHEGFALGARVIGNVFVVEEEKPNMTLPHDGPATGPVTNTNPLQFFVEPRATFGFGLGELRLGALLPLGGRANDAGTWGLRFGAAFFL